MAKITPENVKSQEFSGSFLSHRNPPTALTAMELHTATITYRMLKTLSDLLNTFFCYLSLFSDYRVPRRLRNCLLCKDNTSSTYHISLMFYTCHCPNSVVYCIFEGWHTLIVTTSVSIKMQSPIVNFGCLKPKL